MLVAALTESHETGTTVRLALRLSLVSAIAGADPEFAFSVLQQAVDDANLQAEEGEGGLDDAEEVQVDARGYYEVIRSGSFEKRFALDVNGVEQWSIDEVVKRVAPLDFDRAEAIVLGLPKERQLGEALVDIQTARLESAFSTRAGE
jgi:hypothetical protein